MFNAFARAAVRAGASFLLLVTCTGSQISSAQSPVAPVRLTLDNLYSRPSVPDAALSPSGRWLAAVLSRDKDDAVIVVDLTTGEKKLVTRLPKDSYGGQIDTRIAMVTWKTDDRLLLRLASSPNQGTDVARLSLGSVVKLGQRLIAVDRDGKHVTQMLGDQYNAALVGAWDTSNIQSLLRKDPDHILMAVGGWDGRSLFKVDVNTGEGKVVEPQKESIISWWLDVDGNPIVREEYSIGELRLYRKENAGRWKKYLTIRQRDLEEQPDFVALGPSPDPNKYYVLARPAGHERVGVYLFDLPKEEFGAPLVENPDYDITSAAISRDGTRVLRHCYTVHVRVCEFAEPALNVNMRGVRRFFEESVNVYVADASEDGSVMLLLTEGPNDPPAYYYYRLADRKIEFVGFVQGDMASKALPTATVIRYKARDGQELSGYLTLPPGAKDPKKLPLVLMPHGGPEARDSLEFDPWVQYLAARGYAVFQPNFRGSGGFGRQFAQSGYGEWGRKMQDDLGDGVQTLADQGVVDKARVCIVGASYGGYAALAGATLTPSAYKCVVAIAGIADLEKFIEWRRGKWGKDSEGYTYWLTAIGDPAKDLERIRAVSPIVQVADVRAPVLLVHGDEDDTVPYAQSEAFQKALEKAGRKAELIRLRKEGHGGFSSDNSKYFLSAIGAFLWENLGPGDGVDTPPQKFPAPKK
jgi:dipeptidyl aminopeptidase/acylaminoacyl peptidase